MKTILFDFGNVIAHFDHRRATRKFAPQTDLTEVEVFDAIYNTALEEEFELGNINGDEFVHAACAVIGYRDTHARFRQDFVDIFTANPDVCALIPKLKPKYRLVLASNTNELHAEHFEEKFADTLKHFDALGYSFRAGGRKPHPNFYAHCQTLTEAEPEECLFIDDVTTHVEAAQAFGWKAIHFTTLADLVRDLRRLGIDIVE
jgi:putative hydrolase of the HAD superfamily